MLRRSIPYWATGKRGNSGVTYFFDQFSDGLGGFSFRKLLGSYSGRWGRAINITTLVEADIGFVTVDGYQVADTSVITSLSNGTDTVELMAYDNSFLSIYFTPDPATNRRPILANSGTLVELNGKPAADFPAIRRISMSSNNMSQVDISPVTVISLAKIDTLRQRNLTVATATSQGYYHDGSLTGYNGMGVYDSSLNISSLSDGDLNRRLGFYAWDSTTLKIGANGSSLTDFTGRSGAFDIRNIGCGAIATLQSFSGKIQEVLFFSTNKESDYAAMNTDINSFYSVY